MLLQLQSERINSNGLQTQEEAAIYYLINSANIRSKEMTSEEMKKLEAYIKEAATKENMNLNGN